MCTQAFCEHGRQNIGLIIIREGTENIDIFDVFLLHQFFVRSVAVQHHRMFELIRNRFGTRDVALDQFDVTVSLLERFG